MNGQLEARLIDRKAQHELIFFCRHWTFEVDRRRKVCEVDEPKDAPHAFAID